MKLISSTVNTKSLVYVKENLALYETNFINSKYKIIPPTPFLSPLLPSGYRRRQQPDGPDGGGTAGLAPGHLRLQGGSGGRVSAGGQGGGRGTGVHQGLPACSGDG